ncbi:UDP-glucose 4-epimerase GalE [Kineosporia sp. J2-2]|uniref:UDP-glucose 4-epimerase n=1 Tax=Kineosporia corallincola TaxID=2835133 RepID=A0ABS5TAC5_9ACTN|nr:UDP-glucose 4-epimerase GalE [Kineosporia corallincola]MBT0768003.1 UDP-glucose 4-epimerase GalE [Kineosporia corallincola]
MTWLVTGGAGYIGAHIARCLEESGRSVAVLDDLSTGVRDFVGSGTRFHEGSILDADALRAALTEPDGSPITGVIHCAGFKYAGESVKRPLHTYTQNVQGTQHLLEVMAEVGVENIVFSSSAGVYGTPDVELVTESTATTPESPYGESKLIGEWLLRNVGRVSGLTHTSLRYFNVVGSGHPDIYDVSPHNLFPVVLKTLTEGGIPQVRGNDYDTPDGSCVRDYVHVQDIALAHVAAAARMEAGQPIERVYNLGSGDGASVLEIMTAVAKVTGIAFEPKIVDRRPGDPARIVADGQLAQRDLDWATRHSLEDMVASAWTAWQSVAR